LNYTVTGIVQEIVIVIEIGVDIRVEIGKLVGIAQLHTTL
jgi:hypothetical protein